ncbi:MAG TPA: efflux RND transporter permease subunit [Blastocatellia bacterium]|nr:efflux RND transporter permease subunit [Blastocatellia bacterium]
MQKLAEICVRRPVFATMLIMTLMVLGVFSYNRLTVERFPRVEFPTITITTRLPGAAPQEIETEITDKIEEAVNTISGIDELRSTSSEGVSLVFVTFELERDLDDAAQDVRDKVNRALPELPDDIEQPTIEKLDPDASPIMTISIASNRSLREMTEYADKTLRRQIESVNGVGQALIVGGRKRQINVYLDGDKLRAYNLTVAQVEQALKAQNLEVPGGRVEQTDRTLTLRTLGRVQSSADFNNIVVANRDGYPIKISDVGHSEDGVEDELTAGRLNDKPALLLHVRRQSGTNTVDIVNAVKGRLEELKKGLPAGYSLDVVRDQSTFILASFHAIREHLIIGSVLAALVVLLFMQNLRATIISAIAIPTSIVSTFAAMDAAGITLNAPSMLGLTLSVGIVIDDAIVVLENIFRYIEEKGYKPFDAAIAATREIGLAVMATTLSLVVIFLPVGFMQSIPGRFFKSVALTMAFAIMVSLLVSFTLTPMLSARLLKRLKRKSEEEPPAEVVHDIEKSSWIMRFLDRWYAKILTFSLHHRWIVVGTAFFVVISPVFFAKFIGFNFFPQDDQDEFEVSLRAPEGTSLQKTLEISQQVAAGIRGLKHVGYTMTTIGEDQQRTQNLANIYVRLTPLADRPVSQFDIMGQVRDQVLPKFASYNLRAIVSPVAAISGGGGRFNADISFMLRGPNLEKLDQYSQHLLNKLKAMPGVVDADSSLIVGKPELRAAIDRQKASDLGVSVGDIAQSLRLLVGGDQISTYNEGGEQYEVHVRANEDFRTDPNGISKLNVPSQRLGSIGLDNVVALHEGAGPTQIERNGRQRQVTFTANLKPGFSQSDTLARLNAEVKAMNLPPEYVSGVAGNSKELQRTGRGFIIAFMLSFIFMYIVLAAQFESFIHPVTELLALPLSLPFALISLLITGQQFNMFTMLGLLVLFGMVKKNSILQIDHANGLRAKGMERHDALIQSSRDRLRPILMTTIAFVAGMAPLAWSSGPGAGVNRSTSVVVIGGQTLCLLLTLLMTPVAYSIFDDWVNSSLWGRIAARWETSTGRLRRKAATAASSFLGLFGK